MHQTLTFPPRAGDLRQLRSDIRAMAARFGAPPHVCDHLALVADELVNNAVEHGSAYRRRGLDLAIQITAEGDHLSIEFFDQEMPAANVEELARVLAANANGQPSLDSERGRGLFLLSVYLRGLRAEVAAQGGLRLVGLVARR